LKGILSEHSEQALKFIKNSFQTTALTWILSLGKKFKLFEFEEKPLTLWKKQSTWISCHADGGKEHRAARWIGFAEPATPWQYLSELRLLIWLKRWI